MHQLLLKQFTVKRKLNENRRPRSIEATPFIEELTFKNHNLIVMIILHDMKQLTNLRL